MENANKSPNRRMIERSQERLKVDITRFLDFASRTRTLSTEELAKRKAKMIEFHKSFFQANAMLEYLNAKAAGDDTVEPEDFFDHRSWLMIEALIEQIMGLPRLKRNLPRTLSTWWARAQGFAYGLITRNCVIEPFLVYAIAQKLDPLTWDDWDRLSMHDRTPSFAKLEDFLNTRSVCCV
ncbi:uncharacterized protein LOC106652046 [Trichogramma pretiosum]|uniref:uncharacterized protein LOC106652046 n=1 Tax=Trichogramma pretiosum TaxID=7493 RepID=UPI0006C9ABF4|nr:uncharacterized protein LOC106652046 [Trichogramma pretiosum]XP_014226270.1 uncharacterized protein LOC106652046 [Trichogramma pretiosum]XP_023314179.1 uncharacterized protein LOC106652046 [Trichogramma pretiosum]